MAQDALQVDRLRIEGVIEIGKKAGEDVLSVNKPVDLGDNVLTSSATPTGDNDLMNKASVTSAISIAVGDITAVLNGLEAQDSVISILGHSPESPTTADRYLIKNHLSAAHVTEGSTAGTGGTGAIFFTGDITASLKIDETVVVSGSTDYDGTWTIADTGTYDSENDVTTVLVDEEIITSSAAGSAISHSDIAWDLKNNKIAVYGEDSYTFVDPTAGMYTMIDNLGNFYYYNGTNWIALALGMERPANDARYEQQANLTADVQSIGDARYLKQDTRGTDGTISKQGTASFSSEATKVVTFTTSFADANYKISITPYLNTSFWIDPATKTASGFTINAGSSITGNMDYTATHD